MAWSNEASLQLRLSKFGTDLVNKIQDNDSSDIVQYCFEVVAGEDSRVLTARYFINARMRPIPRALSDRRRRRSGRCRLGR